jgi:hypothetical protein
MVTVLWCYDSAIVATLKIDDVPDELYRRLNERAKKNGRSLSEEARQLLVAAVQPRSLLELRGLGKEVWKKGLGGKDAADYIREERDSWED